MKPFSIRAPGRVNLIGEHIDYNDGFVLPMAISLSTQFQIRPSEDRVVTLHAKNLGEEKWFSLDAIGKQNSWIDYVAGVALELEKSGIELRGFEGTIESTIPMASGLSSSAALEVGAALAFLQVTNVAMPPREIALLCQRAENKFVGVNSGIMDQMAVAACVKDHALLLDCRSLETEHVPFQLADYSVIVTDSAAPRELASSAYNERRAQCEQGLRILQTKLPRAKSLRDVSPQELEKYAAILPEIVEKRVRHVVEEIARTQNAVEDLKRGDMESFGAAMNASHDSLATLYNVSSPELDWLTGWARRQSGVLGSRLTGAGFGGCTVTLIEKSAVENYLARLPREYLAATNRAARCWVCEAEQGAHVE